ncbi:MAG: CvpA family protein [Planctomycetota bacterium]|nr:CvpA family protein [Planctomycetota bacterium]
MQTYDIVMIAVLAIATIFGAIKGLAWQIASLASIVVSYTVAYTFRNNVAQMIRAQEPWNGFLAMLLLYAGTSFVIWVGFRLVSGGIDRIRLRDFDRHMGALLGLAKGVVYCMLITMFAVSLLGPKQQQAIVDSKSGAYMSKIFAATNGIMLPKEIEQIVRPYLNKIEQRFDQRGNTIAAPTSSGGMQMEGTPEGGFVSNILEAGRMFSGSNQSNATTEQGGSGGFGLPSGLGQSGFTQNNPTPAPESSWTQGWFPTQNNQQPSNPVSSQFGSQDFLPQ